jgi:hypothetical protein
MARAASNTYTKATDELSGKRAACVAGMIELLADAKGEPVEWTHMCSEVGMDHQGQLMPAMHALELVGAIDRYTYIENGGSRQRVAFALAEGVTVE